MFVYIHSNERFSAEKMSYIHEKLSQNLAHNQPQQYLPDYLLTAQHNMKEAEAEVTNRLWFRSVEYNRKSRQSEVNMEPYCSGTAKGDENKVTMPMLATSLQGSMSSTRK